MAKSGGYGLGIAKTIDLQSHVIIADVHGTVVSQRKSSARASLSEWKDLLWEPVGACHS